jgi:hypothetical protein
MIMELCEGTYADRMKTNPLSAVEARDVGAKIADALADAHCARSPSPRCQTSEYSHYSIW